MRYAAATGLAFGPDRRLSGRCAVASLLLGLSVLGANAQEAQKEEASSLPGGATSLVETFEDWTVSCSPAAGGTQCILSQLQIQQNGQRLLDFRLNPVPGKSGYDASVVLPFGLEFSNGVTIHLDEGKPGRPFSFRTCLPAGCIVPLPLEKPIVDAIRKGTSLKLTAVSIEKQNIPYSVSLKGFGSAMDRAAALMNAK